MRLRTPAKYTPFFALLLLALATSCGPANPPPEDRPIPSELPASEREAHRLLPFDGAHNFRDLGGYKAADGRSVKWGKLYRTDKLADLSDADLVFFERLGIRSVVDFRSDSERAAEPDRLPRQDPPLRIVEIPLLTDGVDPSAYREKILSGEIEELDPSNMLERGNREFVESFSSKYGPWLRSLAEPENLPMAFHCTAGKDRAGFASAIALLALGVPEETVRLDYMRTNEYTADLIRKRALQILIFSLGRTWPETMYPLLGVEERYIDAAFDEMKERFGSIDAYLREGLGIDDTTRARLQAALLED